MTDRIAAIAAAATALNKFLKPLAIAAMSIATLMPVTTVPASAKDMLFAVIREKDGKPSMHTQQGLSIGLTFEVGSLCGSLMLSQRRPSR